MQVLIAVLSTLLVCVGGALVFWLIKRSGERYREYVSAIQTLRHTAEGMTAAASTFAEIPKMQEGMLRIAKAQTVEIAKLRMSVDQFSKVVTRPEDKVKALEQPSEEEAAMSWDIAQLLAANPEMSAEVAAQRVKDQWEVSSLRSAIGIE